MTCDWFVSLGSVIIAQVREVRIKWERGKKFLKEDNNPNRENL